MRGSGQGLMQQVASLTVAAQVSRTSQTVGTRFRDQLKDLITRLDQYAPLPYPCPACPCAALALPLACPCPCPAWPCPACPACPSPAVSYLSFTLWCLSQQQFSCRHAEATGCMAVMRTDLTTKRTANCVLTLNWGHSTIVTGRLQLAACPC